MSNPLPQIEAGQKQAPPVAEFCGAGIYNPQQKIFAKVKLKVALNSTYTVCDQGHINKTGNALNFLP
jgi:flagellar basal body rod protein FlgG